MGSVMRDTTVHTTPESLYEQVKLVLRGTHPEWDALLLACRVCGLAYPTTGAGSEVNMGDVQDHYDEHHPDVGKVALSLVWIGPGAPPQSNRESRRRRGQR